MTISPLRLAACLCLALALCACGAHKVTGKPAFVSISSMNVQQDSLSATFAVRNINDVPMVIDSVEIMVRVRDAELTRYNSEFQLTVDPNATEEVLVENPPDDFTRQLLSSLQSGEVESLPFFLEGRIHTEEDGWLPFRNEGHLYPVPGKPGQFRSASSASRERN